MTDLEKIAAILASNLSDALKLELVGLVASNPRYITYPIYPVPTYPIYPTWIGTGTSDPLPPPSTTFC